MHVLNVNVAAQVCTHVNTQRNPKRGTAQVAMGIYLGDSSLCYLFRRDHLQDG